MYIYGIKSQYILVLPAFNSILFKTPAHFASRVFSAPRAPTRVSIWKFPRNAQDSGEPRDWRAKRANGERSKACVGDRAKARPTEDALASVLAFKLKMHVPAVLQTTTDLLSGHLCLVMSRPPIPVGGGRILYTRIAELSAIYGTWMKFVTVNCVVDAQLLVSISVKFNILRSSTWYGFYRVKLWKMHSDISVRTFGWWYLTRKTVLFDGLSTKMALRDDTIDS